MRCSTLVSTLSLPDAPSPQVKDAQRKVDAAKAQLQSLRGQADQARAELQSLQEGAYARTAALKRLRDGQETWAVRSRQFCWQQRFAGQCPSPSLHAGPRSAGHR